MEVKNVNRKKLVKDIGTRTTRKVPKKDQQLTKIALRKPRPPTSANNNDDKRKVSASSRSRISGRNENETDSVLTELQVTNISGSDTPHSVGKKTSSSTVKFVSPRQVLQPVNDSSYHITDSGVDDLSSAFLTDFPEYSATDSNSLYTEDFFDRFEYLNTYLSDVQDDCKQPKSILKPDRPLSTDGVEIDSEYDERSLNGRRPYSAALEREVVKKQNISNEPLVDYRPRSVGVTAAESRHIRDSRYLVINQGKTYEVDLDLGRCTCGLHGYPEVVTSDKQSSEIKLEPLVYGYQSGKRICAFASDEISEGALDLDQCMDLILRVPTVDDGESLLDEDQVEEKPDPFPSTLKNFLPWQTRDVPEHVIGVNPMECFVFLPGLKSGEDLPTVPPPQLPHEELNFKYKIKPIRNKTKKHEHPWKKTPVDEWQCSHGQVANTPRIKVIANSGQVMHQTYDGDRTPQILRKEIQELEDLMKGIGSFDGCVVVQMQAEINQIRDTIDEMMPRIQEIQQRDRLKRDASEPTDHFGMKAFYRDHEATVTQIRHQHRLCVLELIHLENSSQLNSGRKIFTRTRSERQQDTETTAVG